MQGKVIDMEKIMRQHELTPAIGNQNVNARGDELGQGGKIIRKREDIIQDYYEGHPESKPTPRVDVPKKTENTAPQAVTTPQPVSKKAKSEE